MEATDYKENLEREGGEERGKNNDSNRLNTRGGGGKEGEVQERCGKGVRCESITIKARRSRRVRREKGGGGGGKWPDEHPGKGGGIDGRITDEGVRVVERGIMSPSTITSSTQTGEKRQTLSLLPGTGGLPSRSLREGRSFGLN